MGVILAMALAVLAAGADDVKAPDATRRCLVGLHLAGGWTTVGEARVARDGKVEAGVLVTQPPVISVDGAPARERSPGLIFHSALGPKAGPAPGSILRITVFEADISDGAGPGWTGQLLADGAELASGRMVWDQEPATSDHAPPQAGPRERLGRFVIDHPSAQMIAAIGKAQDVTTIITAPGRAPWTAHYGKLRLSSVQAGQDKALDLMSRAAQGADIPLTPDHAFCESSEQAAQPPRPLKMPSIPPLPYP